MDKVWQYIIGALLGAVLASFITWKQQEPDKRLSQVFGIWWFALSICAVILFFTGKPGSIYFLTAGSASLITAACLHLERNLNILFGVIASLPASIGLAIWIRGNQPLGQHIILAAVALQGLGALINWQLNKKKEPPTKPTATTTSPGKPTHTGRGPRRGGRR